jgi:hypothetical protein
MPTATTTTAALLRSASRSHAACPLALLGSSCSVGKGEGSVSSSLLQAPACFYGPYEMRPTFFASNPYRETQTLRIQRKDDLVENSDGVQILVSDTERVRSKLGQPLRVGLPPEVTPPGVPIVPDPDPPLVQLTLYLHDTCHGQNVALHAIDGTITFQQLFDGDRNEERAENKLSEADFSVNVGDPRDQPAAGGPIPQDKLSPLQGHFSFYFERGQPAQPFP